MLGEDRLTCLLGGLYKHLYPTEKMSKIIVYTLLFFSACFQQKPAPDTVESWLEQTFPGQFQVENAYLEMPAYSIPTDSMWQALLTDKSNPEVQFRLFWKEGIRDFGLRPEQVRETHEYAKECVAKSPELYKLLNSYQLDSFSVCIIDSRMIYIQVFSESAPANRERIYAAVKNAFIAKGEDPNTQITIEIMEPLAYRTKYQELIPSGHWLLYPDWQKENEIMSICFHWRNATTALPYYGSWKANPAGKRNVQYRENARRLAQAWAANHIPKPFFIDTGNPIEFEFSKHLEEATLQIEPMDSPAIRYAFPYFDRSPQTEETKPKGYVTGIYYPDNGRMIKIQTEKADARLIKHPL